MKPLLLVPSLLVLLFSVIIAFHFLKTPHNSKEMKVNMEEAGENSEINGVKIQKNPPHSKLDELGVFTWPQWNGQPSIIPWTFEAEETMYLLEGRVKVSIDGHDGSFEIGGGDLAVFPKGMKITWEVIEAVSKRYHLKK